MKKRVLFLTVLLACVLTACGTKNDSAENGTGSAVETRVDETINTEPGTKVEGKNAPEVTAESTTILEDKASDPDYEEIYQDVLDKMHRIIAHPEISESDDEDGVIAIEEAANYQENPLQDIGYAFIDLSGDGFCELVTGNLTNDNYPGNTLLAVYTYQDGEVVYSFGGTSRNPHFLMGDGRILYYASYGYQSYGFGLSALNPEGTTLTSEELIYTGIGPDGETQMVFENKEGRWDEDSAYLSDMTLEDYEKVWENYIADTQYVEMTPFEQYTHPDGYAGVEEILPVYVSYVDENHLPDCEQYILDDEDYSRWILINANMPVKHFYVMKLNNMEVYEDGTFNYFTEEKVEYDTLDQGTEIAVKMALPETLPYYAISYYEENGTFRSYALTVSGEDGSVRLMDLNNQ